MTDTTFDLTQLLSAETLQRLRDESAHLQRPLTDLVRDALEEYVENLEEPLEDTPDAKIIADFKEAWHQAMMGQVYPIEDLLTRLRDYFTEPSDEEILQGIREGMRDALAGNTRPAGEFLDELDRLSNTCTIG